MEFWKIKCFLVRNDKENWKNCEYTGNLKDQRHKIANVSLTWKIIYRHTCASQMDFLGGISAKYGMLKTEKRGLNTEGTGGLFRTGLTEIKFTYHTIHPFTVCNPLYSQSYATTIIVSFRTFYHPKKKLHTITPFPQLWATTNQLFVPVEFTYSGHSI